MPVNRDGITVKKDVCGFRIYVIVNFFEDGKPGEVFCRIAKEGSDLAGWVEALCLTISVAWQYGVPWSVLREKYVGTIFGTDDEEHPSLLDALAKTIDEAIKANDLHIHQNADDADAGKGNDPD